MYEKLLEIRTEVIDHENNWLWIKEDEGAFYGPMENWYAEHHHKFFKYLRKQDVIVTAGANMGMYVRFYAKKFKHVYAFEPDPLNFHCMVVNNQFDNVIKMQCALGEKNELISVQRTGFKNCGTFKVNTQHSTSKINYIPCITIDILRLRACDLIQLDVEGYEEKVIRGSVETIKRFRPVIIAEGSLKRKECGDFIRSLDYVNKENSGRDTIWVPREFE